MGITRALEFTTKRQLNQWPPHTSGSGDGQFNERAGTVRTGPPAHLPQVAISIDNTGLVTEGAIKPGKSETIVKELFALAGITIDGHEPYDLQVHNKQFYRRVLRDGSLGFGEAYMDGWWDCDALDQLIDRVSRTDLEGQIKSNWRATWHVLRSRIFNLQRVSRAFRVGEKHYDIGNDLYQACWTSA